VHRAFQLLVLDLAASPDGLHVQHVACFFDTDLFRVFGLPEILPPR
jgi:hypothetical protein